MKQKKWLLAVLPALLAVIIIGILLLPKEEETASIAVTDQDNKEVYQFYTVTRGDLEQWENVTCKFQSLEQEHLRFQMDGRTIGTFHVEVGDNVVPGQLLAELENDRLDALLEEARAETARLEKELSFARENLEIVEYSDELYGQAESYEEALSMLEQDYDLAQRRQQELEEQKKGESLYAGIEGTVTYIRDYNRSSLDNDSIVLSDRGAACFYADTEHYTAMKPGMEVTLTTDEGPLQAVVTQAEELGFEPPEIQKDGTCRVYFVPKTATTMMNDASQASLKLLLDSRKDVLIVSGRAVSFAGGEPYVYYLDEQGVCQTKPVELGLRVYGKYEVLSGLTEGEALIIR